jgi:transposase
VQAIGGSVGGLTTKVHAITANAEIAVELTLSQGQCHDAPQGRILMETLGKQDEIVPLLMDRAYEDDLTRFTAQMLRFEPVVPPKSNRKDPWDYDKELYKRRNEVERLFRLIQGSRRVFCRFDKLDIMYLSFIKLALIFRAVKKSCA